MFNQGPFLGKSEKFSGLKYCDSLCPKSWFAFFLVIQLRMGSFNWVEFSMRSEKWSVFQGTNKQYKTQQFIVLLKLFPKFLIFRKKKKQVVFLGLKTQMQLAEAENTIILFVCSPKFWGLVVPH